MQFVVKCLVFGQYYSLQFVFDCILDVEPGVSPCDVLRKM